MRERMKYICLYCGISKNITYDQTIDEFICDLCGSNNIHIFNSEKIT